MKKEDIKIINEHQKAYYEAIERKNVPIFLGMFSDMLEKMRTRSSLKIVDIGGGGGMFAVALKEYFPDTSCEVFVVDTTEYESWSQYSDKVSFVKASASDLDKLFEENSVDIVFANRVFHHLVRDTWSHTTSGMCDIMKKIARILKDDGFLGIVEIFCNGLLCDKASSKILYLLTSCTIRPVVALCNRFGAESAGVGVCFLSEKMWLRLFSQSGLVVDTFTADTHVIRLPWYKRLVLWNKNISYKNLFLLRKSSKNA